MQRDQLEVAARKRNLRCPDEATLDAWSEATEELNLTAAEAIRKLEVFMLNRKLKESELSLRLLEDFKEHQRKQSSKNAHRLKTAGHAGPSWDSYSGAFQDKTNRQDSPFTPEAASKRSSLGSGRDTVLEAAASPQAELAHAGGPCQAVSTLNGHLQAAPCQVTEVPLPLAMLSTGPASGQTYMSDKISDKVAHIDDRISSFAAAWETEHPGIVCSPVSATAQEPGWFIGRICCDSEGRLNDSSILLEGNIAVSGGQRTHLDLSRLPSYRVFPGQVVAIYGMNPSGGCIIALELHSSLPSLPPPSLRTPDTEGEAMDIDVQHNQGPAALVAACGPFMGRDSLTAGHLQRVLQDCRQQTPHLLVLMGPFLDEEHPQIGSGKLDEHFEAVFEQEIMRPVCIFASTSPGTTVVMIPSTRDVHHHPVFPTPPLDPAETLAGPSIPSQAAAPLPYNVIMLPNPAVFRIGETVVGAMTTDAMKHLASQEVFRNAPGQPVDRMACLASHLLGQRNFYPLFPPPLGIMLDSSLAEHLRLPCNVTVDADENFEQIPL
ncbi:hypothetical protein WJX84_007828 [Apatococcus fuscideae]|uniref:DNA polymerase alpha subunit B n=1 Tax=Apatococcus fuscideae TaxID=2026836 RepID=A0AAW1T882_9CHLO